MNSMTPSTTDGYLSSNAQPSITNQQTNLTKFLRLGGRCTTRTPNEMELNEPWLIRLDHPVLWAWKPPVREIKLLWTKTYLNKQHVVFTV